MNMNNMKKFNHNLATNSLNNRINDLLKLRKQSYSVVKSILHHQLITNFCSENKLTLSCRFDYSENVRHYEDDNCTRIQMTFSFNKELSDFLQLILKSKVEQILKMYPPFYHTFRISKNSFSLEKYL